MADSTSRPASFIGHVDTPAQETPEKAAHPIYFRMEGEPMLWYNRFKIYRGLGVKRSLQAAVTREREKVKALESPNLPKIEASEPTTPGKREKKTVDTSHLQEVPKPKEVQVPGSWKKACRVWSWVERARAFDEHLIDKQTEYHFNRVMEGLAAKSERVNLLKVMTKTAIDCYNANDAQMPWNVKLAFLARIQSLVREIREEMSTFDEELERAIIRRDSRERYQKLSPEEWEALKASNAAKKQGK